jgi:beta-lactam-binding protein with PASTA domain
VVSVDPTARDVPERPRTVTVTETATTTTEATPTVPDVTGQEPSAARDVLEGAGYAVAVQEESLLCGINASLCEVVGQDPPAGTRASSGSEVTIVIDNT